MIFDAEWVMVYRQFDSACPLFILWRSYIIVILLNYTLGEHVYCIY
jgi:hypothetical protein